MLLDRIQRYEHRLPGTLTTSSAKPVYRYLRTENEATINELHRAFGMKKITLYSLLQTLTATELVDQEEPSTRRTKRIRDCRDGPATANVAATSLAIHGCCTVPIG